MTDIDRVVDKVRKLHAHAESAAQIGNEAEAQAFAAKVQELLTQYKLSMSEVEYARRDATDPIDQAEVNLRAHGLKVKGARVEWQERLAAIIAQAYFCRITVLPGSNRVWLVGRASDRDVAEFMLVTITRFLDGDGRYDSGLAGREYVCYYRECEDAGDVTRARGFRPSFLLGFIHRLAARFSEEAERQRRAVTHGSTALVRVTNALTEVNAWMDARYGKADKAATLGGHSGLNGVGYRKGRQAADELDLNKKAIERASVRPNALLRD